MRRLGPGELQPTEHGAGCHSLCGACHFMRHRATLAPIDPTGAAAAASRIEPAQQQQHHHTPAAAAHLQLVAAAAATAGRTAAVALQAVLVRLLASLHTPAAASHASGSLHTPAAAAASCMSSGCWGGWVDGGTPCTSRSGLAASSLSTAKGLTRVSCSASVCAGKGQCVC